MYGRGGLSKHKEERLDVSISSMVVLIYQTEWDYQCRLTNKPIDGSSGLTCVWLMSLNVTPMTGCACLHAPSGNLRRSQQFALTVAVCSVQPLSRCSPFNPLSVHQSPLLQSKSLLEIFVPTQTPLKVILLVLLPTLDVTPCGQY